MNALKKFAHDVVLAAVMTATVVSPLTVNAAGPDVSVVDVRQVESSIVTAQNQMVSGGFDEGLRSLEAVRSKAVTTELADRVAFVAKLAEVRLAERLGDQSKVMAALNDAFNNARQPDQMQAVWSIGHSVTQATLAAKDNTAPAVEFMARVASSMKTLWATLEVSRLRMAAGHVGAAEADLRNAARQAETASDWSAWLGVVSQLASTVDGGQSPQAGADVFSRLREVAKPVQTHVDIAKGRYLLNRGFVEGVEPLIESCVADAKTDADLMSALSLQFDLAVTLNRIDGKADVAKLVVAKAEELAMTCPAGTALANTRGNAMLSLGHPEAAADIFWSAARAAKTPQEQEPMLTAFGSAMIAAGDSANLASKLTDKLRAIEARPVVYVAVASAMVRANDPVGALKLLGAVPTQAFAEDAQAVAAVKPLMEHIQNQRQQIAKTQGERARAIATALDAAARESKTPQTAETLATQAADMSALAGQVEK